MGLFDENGNILNKPVNSEKVKSNLNDSSVDDNKIGENMDIFGNTVEGSSKPKQMSVDDIEHVSRKNKEMNLFDEPIETTEQKGERQNKLFGGNPFVEEEPTRNESRKVEEPVKRTQVPKMEVGSSPLADRLRNRNNSDKSVENDSVGKPTESSFHTENYNKKSSRLFNSNGSVNKQHTTETVESNKEQTEEKKKQERIAKKKAQMAKASKNAYVRTIKEVVNHLEEVYDLKTLIPDRGMACDLPVREFTSYVSDNIKNTELNVRKEKRVEAGSIMCTLAYVTGILRYKGIKVLDFTRYVGITNVIDVLGQCTREGGNDAKLISDMNILLGVLDKLEQQEGVGVATSLASYRVLRLVYVLLLYSAKADLSMLSDFILLQLQICFSAA